MAEQAGHRFAVMRQQADFIHQDHPSGENHTEASREDGQEPPSRRNSGVSSVRFYPLGWIFTMSTELGIYRADEVN
jgi:hypothetical protein